MLSTPFLEPIVVRSKPRAVCNTRHPSFSWPTRFSDGTPASVKHTVDLDGKEQEADSAVLRYVPVRSRGHQTPASVRCRVPDLLTVYQISCTVTVRSGEQPG